MSSPNTDFLGWYAIQTPEVQNGATREVSRLLAAMVRSRRSWPRTPPRTQPRFAQSHRLRQPPTRTPPDNLCREGYMQSTPLPPDLSFRLSQLANPPPSPSTPSALETPASQATSDTTSTRQALDNLLLAPLQQGRFSTEYDSSVDEGSLFGHLESFAGDRRRYSPFTDNDAVPLPLLLPTVYVPPSALLTQETNNRFVTRPINASPTALSPVASSFALPPEDTDVVRVTPPANAIPPASSAQAVNGPFVPPPLPPPVFPLRLHQYPPLMPKRAPGLLRRISARVRRQLPK